MNKILITAFLALSLPAISMATPSSFNGFYAGLGVGGATTHHLNAIDTNATADGSSRLRIEKITNLSTDSLVANLFLGFGHVWNRFYFGGEASAELMNTNSRNVIRLADDGTSIQHFIRQKDKVSMGEIGFNVDILPGILLTPQTLVYARVGIAPRRLKYTSEASTDVSSVGTAYNSSINRSRDRNVVGLRLGFGIMQKLTDRWAIRMDYVYTRYSSSVGVTSTGTMSNDPAGGLAIDSNIRRLQTYAATLGFIYHFGLLDILNSSQGNAHEIIGGFNGFYTGVGFGFISASFYSHIQGGTGADSPGNSLFIHKTPKLSSSSPRGNIFFGYGHAWGSFYLGNELSANISDIDTDSEDRTADASNVESATLKNDIVLRNFGVSFDVLPGVLLTPTTLLTVKIGASINRLRLNSNADFIDPDVAALYARASTSAKRTYYIAGLRLGSGITEKLSNHFALRADYVLTIYQSRTTSGTGIMTGSSISTPTGKITTALKVHPVTQAAMLSLIYHFNVGATKKV